MFNMNMILILLFLMFMLFSFSKKINPMIFGLKLLMFNIFNSIILMLNMKNSWFSFLLFLIILGGLMILFLYFLSLIMNLKFKKFNYIQFFYYVYFLMILILLFYDKLILFDKFNFLENLYLENENIINNLNLNFNFNDKLLSLMMLFNKPLNFITLNMLLYLFFSMTTIVKICLINNKSIRMMKN